MDGRGRRLAAIVALGAVSVLLPLALAEVVLRIVNVEPETYGTHSPGFHLVTSPDTSLLPGVRGGVKHFTIAEHGLRGRSLRTDTANLRILVIGGSTTEQYLLDDADAWPAVLEGCLGMTDGRRPWVGAAGKSGLNSRDHIVQLKYLSEVLPKIDVVIVLAGLNDLSVALAQGDHYAPPPPLADPAEEYRVIRRAFAVIPRSRRLAGPPAARWYQRLVLYDFARRARNAVMARSRIARWDTRGAAVERWRELRRAAPHRRDTLPDLTGGLDEYRRNLTRLSEMSRNAGQRLILVTQPVLWHERQTATEEQRLWFGGMGDFMAAQVDTYYTARVMRQGMDRFNRVMLEVCARERVDCVDLATPMSGKAELFFDDAHFTEAGAHAVARQLARHFRGDECADQARSPGTHRVGSGGRP